MRQLLLLRHTKSSWANPEIDDFDRPLNKRGRRSAAALADWFAREAVAPDAVWCSAARRTRETWEALGLQSDVHLRDDLYLAEAQCLLRMIRDCAAGSLLVIGHNPGLGELAHRLGASSPDHTRWHDFPTGAMVDLRFDVDGFHDVEPRTGHVAQFLTPHDLVNA